RRAGTAVAIESRDRLTRLDPARFVDPGFEYPYTLERALCAAFSLFRGERRADGDTLSEAVTLDHEQRRAVEAGDGVVQVVAPAGSGKTAVLIERVRELLRRGVRAEQILCATFNRDARLELRDRLQAAGVTAVQARTFHSVGMWLMREEGLLRPRGLRGQLSLGQWRRLSTIVAREEGRWIDPADARSAISSIKLGRLATPAEFRREMDRHEDGPALARLYELYERHLVQERVHDFDDLVLVAVRALREDPELRRRWQERFEQVLVDEYQDIEPAQELLVRILAAPQDGFFCVGDEDQTLYGWRRASVRRILELDLAYPGLERIALAHNYRCPSEVVEVSRRLIEHNRIRFPKAIRAIGSADEEPTAQGLDLHEHDDGAQAAVEIAERLATRRREEIVVLARTTNLLRAVATACAARRIAISAPEAVFEPHGARGALEAYLRLCGSPRDARADDVALVCRVPGRGLALGKQDAVASSLVRGERFEESLLAVAGDARESARLAEAGLILDRLCTITDASQFIAHLRQAGGLDEYFREYEQTFGATEQVELEVLEQSQREARGMTVAEYSRVLRTRTDELRSARDDTHGIELTTIHRAKGRQWPEVHVFSCEEGQLPHRRALEVGTVQRAAGEGIEAERRLAYVAFTRAQRRLVLHTTRAAASRFLTEAGLSPSTPYHEPSPQQPAVSSARQATPNAGRRIASLPAGEAGDVVREAARIGLSYALRTAPSPAVALEAAAITIEQRLVGPQTASQRITVGQLLTAIETLTPGERADILTALAAPESRRLVGLTLKQRGRLTRSLRELASGGPLAKGLP
ncbi:MAG: ATP-dependent helicase, partial [Solirubrobacteraceae bacterium]